MPKLLICFFNTFPFGRGEEFFEHELPVAVNHYDKIILVTRGDTNAMTRSLPEGITVIALPNSSSSLSRTFSKRLLFLKFIVSEIFIYPTEVIAKLKAIPYYWKNFKKQISEADYLLNSKEIKENLSKDDSIIFYDYWFGNFFWSIKSLKKITSGPSFYISRAHRYDLYDEVFGAPQPFRNIILNCVNNVYACSFHGANYLQKRVKKAVGAKILCSYLGTPDYGQGKMPDENHYTIVSCSSLLTRKRVDRIIEVLKDIKIAYRWYHFGGGQLYESLVKMATESLPQGSFQFMGHLSNKDLIQFYKDHKVDLFISMSESEGLPVSMMEVISFGIPILAIDCMGVKELVNEKVGAVFLKETSNEKIASGLVGILNGVSRNMEKRIAIRQYWREKFSETNYNKFYGHVASSFIRLL